MDLWDAGYDTGTRGNVTVWERVICYSVALARGLKDILHSVEERVWIIYVICD